MKPTHAKPSLYAYYFELIKEIGLKYGYNILLHGSINRDLDLIAIPWQEAIGDKLKMINEICSAIGGDILKEENREKPHGRECWIININRTIKTKYDGMVSNIIECEDPQYYIDLSIMPTINKSLDGK